MLAWTILLGHFERGPDGSFQIGVDGRIRYGQMRLRITEAATRKEVRRYRKKMRELTEGQHGKKPLSKADLWDAEFDVMAEFVAGPLSRSNPFVLVPSKDAPDDPEKLVRTEIDWNAETVSERFSEKFIQALGAFYSLVSAGLAQES